MVGVKTMDPGTYQPTTRWAVVYVHDTARRIAWESLTDRLHDVPKSPGPAHRLEETFELCSVPSNPQLRNPTHGRLARRRFMFDGSLVGLMLFENVISPAFSGGEESSAGHLGCFLAMN